MNVQFPTSIYKSGNSLVTVIPKQIVKALKLKAGDMLYITATDLDTIMLKKVK